MSPKPPTKPNKLRDQLLEPSVMGKRQTPEGMIPPNQDMNYGVEMKAQPSFMQKALKFIGGDPTAGLDPTLSSMTGIVINPKNAARIASEVPRFSAQNPGMVLDDFYEALRYMQAKNPYLMGKINKVIRQPPGSGSGMDTPNRVLHLEQGNSFDDTVRDIGHELSHLYQERHRPLANYIYPDQDFAKYLAQPAEQYAVKAEKTAVDTLNSFRRALKHYRASQLPDAIKEANINIPFETPAASNLRLQAPNWGVLKEPGALASQISKAPKPKPQRTIDVTAQPAGSTWLDSVKTYLNIK